MQAYFKKSLKKSQCVVYNIVCIVTYAMQIICSERKKEEEFRQKKLYELYI